MMMSPSQLLRGDERWYRYHESFSLLAQSDFVIFSVKASVNKRMILALSFNLTRQDVNSHPSWFPMICIICCTFHSKLVWDVLELTWGWNLDAEITKKVKESSNIIHKPSPAWSDGFTPATAPAFCCISIVFSTHQLRWLNYVAHRTFQYALCA